MYSKCMQSKAPYKLLCTLPPFVLISLSESGGSTRQKLLARRMLSIPKLSSAGEKQGLKTACIVITQWQCSPGTFPLALTQSCSSYSPPQLLAPYACSLLSLRQAAHDSTYSNHWKGISLHVSSMASGYRATFLVTNLTHAA